MTLDRAVRAFLPAVPLAAAVLVPVPALAENLTTKTTNIESPETTPVGELHFPFTHRFGLAGTKVVNTPTLTLSTGLTPATSVAFRWASNSGLAPKDPANAFHQAVDPVNEFELALKQRLVAQGSGSPLNLTGVLAYNTAANSGDAGLVAGHSFGPLTLLANAKAFSSGFGVGGYTASAGGGVIWRITRYLNVSADVNGVVWAQRDPLIFASSNTPAVSLGLGFEIPYSPHTVLLYVTNSDTHTLQGTGRGAPPTVRTAQPNTDIAGQILDRVKFGFEFNVPFSSWTRWAHIVAPPQDQPPAPADAPAGQPGHVHGEPSAPAPAQDPAQDPGQAPAEAPAPAAPPAPAPAAPGGEATPSAPPAGTVAPPPAAARPLPEQVVTIKGFAFKPETITVPAGTVIRWVNQDSMFHTVTATDKKSFDSGNIDPGKSWSRKFDKAGTYPYFCTPHPFMTGKVVVK